MPDSPPLSLAELINENAALRERVRALQEQVSFLTTHKALAAGFAGETLISTLVQGSMTAYAASYDVSTNSGSKIEVKYARINQKYKYKPDYKRWAWGKIFGESGAKNFDYLCLVGERDERYSSMYKDPASPYVIFFVPFEEVADLTMAMNGGRYRAIQIPTNPRMADRNQTARRLFQQYQTSTEEMQIRFGL